MYFISIDFLSNNLCIFVIMKKLQAFTLTEVLVVLVIIGILVLLALPRIMPLISKAKSTEAKLQLSHLYNLEKSYYYLNTSYSTDMNSIDYEQEKLTTSGGTANYRIEVVSASKKNFKATATAVEDFDGDGVYNIWEIDQDKNLREITKD